MPHWGREYYYQPIYECVELAHRMVDAGADAVVASHPHQIQPVVKYKGKTIAFSMGNFLFPDFYMSPPRPIWYPRHDEDLSNVKDFVGYPFPISEPIKQVWNKKSRVGSIIQMEINNSIKVKTRYVKNSRRNIVDLHHLDFITKTIITIYGIGTQNKVLHLLLRKGTSFIRIIKRIFHF
jgi:poly-gamma-glutamate synthesis protein (capsule biosynthesis protein)